MIQLTNQQQTALEALQSFIGSPEERVFILTGPAGSGKTTLVKAVIDWAVCACVA